MCRALGALLLAATLGLVACGDETDKPAPGSGVQVLPITVAVVDDVVVDGGSLLVDLTGTELLVPQSVALSFAGTVDGRAVDTFVLAQFTDRDGQLALAVPWADLASTLGLGGDATFDGDLAVTVEDVGGSLRGEGRQDGLRLTFVSALTPSLSAPASVEIFLNELTPMDGDGVLRDGEGQTWLEVDGDFTPDGGAARAVTERIPVEIGPEGRRDAQVRWLAYVFGVRPGAFEGTVTPVNVHSGGTETRGSASGIQVTLRQSEMDGFVEAAASRGEIATVLGRGFIEPDTERGQSMYFEFDGTFYLNDGSEFDVHGDDVVRIAPEQVPSFTEARIVLRTETRETGGGLRLTGLTAMPGTFEGTVTPVLVDGATTSHGLPWTGRFTITPTHQVVYIRFLPGFSTSLDTYGLRNAETDIRTRILDVVRRDYHDFFVDFVTEEPDDFVEFSLIEVGGPDPNNAGLFGLDNTAGKDTGNLRLNDWIGGTNAESGELGYYVFGGVFIESFRTFSPTLEGTSEVASAKFDEIFAPFMPALGGTVIDAAEGPSGARAEQIDLAVHAFGSVIGNTITHEIGHSLGLAYFPEDEFGPGNRFHNDFDEPGSIMDAGGNRTFEERAELEGAAPPVFNSRNRSYLERILPRP